MRRCFSKSPSSICVGKRSRKSQFFHICLAPPRVYPNFINGVEYRLIYLLTIILRVELLILLLLKLSLYDKSLQSKQQSCRNSALFVFSNGSWHPSNTSNKSVLIHHSWMITLDKSGHIQYIWQWQVGVCGTDKNCISIFGDFGVFQVKKKR